MSSRRDVLFVFLYASAVLLITTKCDLCENNSPSYMYSSVSVTCRNVNGEFPTFAKPISVLKCIDCNIPTLDEHSLVFNFKGDTFNLSYSHIRTISSTAFKNFENTTHRLLLNNNEINSVAKKVFSTFPLLDDIDLKNNNISSLEDKTFENTNVSLLDLSNNRINKISGLLSGLKVTKLNISNNEITNLPQNVFDETTFWTGRQWRTGYQLLDLSNNFISELNPGTFKSPTSDNVLRSLYLQNNKITVIQNNTFDQMSYLRYLSLEKNYISKLYRNSFKGLTSLTTLILKDNKLTEIPPSLFADLQHLEVLDVSRNSLTTLTMNTFSGLSYLTKLNISHNNLKELDDSHIFPLGRLITLDISDTRLKDINLQSILEHHYKLRILVLNDNFWICKNLVKMYKQMNQRIGGFDYPSHHFDVPNLHGIACSRKELDSYDMTFDEFLEIISEDRVFEDLYDSRINNEFEDVHLEDIADVFKSVIGIYYMVLIVTIVSLMLLLHVSVRCVFTILRNRNIIQNDKFGFAYNSNQDNVRLI